MPTLDVLPDEMVLKILSTLPYNSLLDFIYANENSDERLYNIAIDNSLWYPIYKQYINRREPYIRKTSYYEQIKLVMKFLDKQKLEDTSDADIRRRLTILKRVPQPIIKYIYINFPGIELPHGNTFFFYIETLESYYYVKDVIHGDIRILNKYRESALHYAYNRQIAAAILRDYPECLNLLSGSHPLNKLMDHKTALFNAIVDHRDKTAMFLSEVGALYNVDMLVYADNRMLEYLLQHKNKFQDASDVQNIINASFFSAIRDLDQDRANILVKNGVDIDEMDASGQTVLAIATINDNFNLLYWAIDNGAQLDKIIGKNNLYLFAKSEHMIDELLYLKVDVNLQDIDGRTALFYISDPNVSQLLFDNGADPYIEDYVNKNVAIHINNNYAVIKNILDNINPKDVSYYINTQDINGRTPLFYLTNARASRLLLDKGADPYIEDYIHHNLAIHVNNSYEVVENILDYMDPKDINIENDQYKTPLDCAKKASIKKLFIERGGLRTQYSDEEYNKKISGRDAEDFYLLEENELDIDDGREEDFF